jgi:hypothetical protein
MLVKSFISEPNLEDETCPLTGITEGTGNATHPGNFRFQNNGADGIPLSYIEGIAQAANGYNYLHRLQMNGWMQMG